MYKEEKKNERWRTKETALFSFLLLLLLFFSFTEEISSRNRSFYRTGKMLSKDLSMLKRDRKRDGERERERLVAASKANHVRKRKEARENER